MFKIAIIAPTCFFYQSPIYRELSDHPCFDLTVYFCSDEGFSGKDVLSKFSTEGNWGNPEDTLSGYKYKFLRNFSPTPSYLKWPFGLMNFGLWKEIKKAKPDVAVIMSWVNITDWVVILACLLFRVRLLILTDANILAESDKSKWTSLLKNMLLGKIIFRVADGFLHAGTANKLLYKKYGVPDNKLVPFAFSWETKDFLAMADGIKAKRSQLRRKLGIPDNQFVILYCGRLSPEKAPIHLLEAFRKMKSANKSLIYVGDGKLLGELKDYVRDHKLGPVRFVGFQSREDVPDYYALSDVLVLPSLKEATGAVVTEAMAFGLPVIVSDQVGFGLDLVKHGRNGYVFPTGDTSSLAGYLDQMTNMSKDQHADMSKKSLELAENWAKLDLADSLFNYLEALYASRRPNNNH